jgi:hypothetical protein
MSPLGIPMLQSTPAEIGKFFGLKRKELLARRVAAQEHLLKQQKRYVERHNRYAHQMKYKVGDKVWYKNTRINQPGKGKWKPKWGGPYPIVRVISPVAYELGIDGRRYMAHAMQIKPYFEAKEDWCQLAEDIDQWESDDDPDDMIDEGIAEQEEDSGNYIVMNPPPPQFTPGPVDSDDNDETDDADDNNSLPGIGPRTLTFRGPDNTDTISSRQARRLFPRTILNRFRGSPKPVPPPPSPHVHGKRAIRKPLRYRDD